MIPGLFLLALAALVLAVGGPTALAFTGVGALAALAVWLWLTGWREIRKGPAPEPRATRVFIDPHGDLWTRRDDGYLRLTVHGRATLSTSPTEALDAHSLPLRRLIASELTHHPVGGTE